MDVRRKMLAWMSARLWLAFILILAVSFLYQFQPYSMNEDVTVGNVTNFLSEKTIIPLNTNYPTLFSYLAAPFITLDVGIHYLHSGAANPQDYAIFLEWVKPIAFARPARLVSFICLAIIVILLGRFLNWRFSLVPAFIAIALLLTVGPLVTYSGLALPDVLMLVFTLASFLVLVGHWQKSEDPDTSGRFNWAAIFAGLSLTSKYNGAAAALLVALSIVEAGIQKRSFIFIVRQSAIAAALCIVAFVLGSPGWLLAPSHMLDGILYVLGRAEYGKLGMSGYPLVGQIELLFDGSPALFVLAVFGITSMDSCNRVDRHAIYLLIATFLLPALNRMQAPHYILPAYISLCYFAARFAAKLGRWRVAAPVFCGLAVAVFVFVNVHAVNYLKPDSLTLAKEWIEKNVGPNDPIVVDWGHVPRVLSAQDVNRYRQLKEVGVTLCADASIEECLMKSAMLRRYIREHERLFDLQPLDAYTRSWLDTTPAEFFVTSNMVFDRFFNNGIFTRIEPDAATGIGKEFAQRKEFYSALFASPRWHVAQKITSNDGNVIYIFRREAKASQQQTSNSP
jgi:hypothetical protein